ncbi:FAD-binding protein [Rhodococcus sp. PAMC28707]|uniref:FAD-dependent oxidoreductase n=1 Tax=unclassified Rhodococcus (in: high G+C Gram-positive bacteria) TaxID=192944 RepID=UPI00109E243A|nr:MULTISPECIES: FAD-binding protein [unclassified Rhodococcus (in: high G+C Gram-positive bacteria)]QCB52064.1 FAD-binding protein [Rhodococcus sp. PAMC28705]QCB59768.1 FAD-binding protein [Rhodococcus sp. PAMC28707]
MSENGPDLVVAGAGGGLVAALRAAQRGLDVLVVEASEHFKRGNNTAMSTAMIPGAGSRWQRESGIDDSPGQFVDDILRKTKGTADERLAHALANVSAQLVEWLADYLKMPLELVTDFSYPGHSQLRCHTVEGRHGTAIVDHLVRAVADEPRIDLLVPARLTEVTVDVEGRVDGVVIALPDGSTESIPTKAVLLATNGYGADPDLVADYVPEIAAARYHGSEYSVGDALSIGARLGAESKFLDSYQGHAALSKKAGTLVGWATVMHGGVVLDLEGRRFGDETTGYSEYAAALAARPHSEGWIIIDHSIYDKCLSFKDFRQTVESGALVWADGAAELAEATGLPSDAVVDELSTLDSVARGIVADPYGRTSFEHTLAAPYAAIKIVPALFHTQGGLVVDENARVLRPSGTPIDGLFASGGAAMGISGHGAAGYLAGNGLLPALGLAYLAAGYI